MPFHLGECPDLKEGGVKLCTEGNLDSCPEARDYLNQGLNEKLLYKNQPSLKEVEIEIGRKHNLGDGKRLGVPVELDENDQESPEPSEELYTLEDWHHTQLEDDGEKDGEKIDPLSLVEEKFI